jgi:hypothetical protein
MAAQTNYDSIVTLNVLASGAISEGLLYGLDTAGKAVLADRTTPQTAIGFAVKGLTAAQAAAGEKVALSPRGIVQCVAADIAGSAFTLGATVYVDTAGKYTTTKPTTNGHLHQPVGVAMTTTKVFVNLGVGFILAQTAGNSNIGV